MWCSWLLCKGGGCPKELLYEDVKLKPNGDPRMLEMPGSWYSSKESCRHGVGPFPKKSFMHWSDGLPKSFGAEIILARPLGARHGPIQFGVFLSWY